MVTGTSDTIAPTSLIVPRKNQDDQQVSGAIWISGGVLFFNPYGGAIQKVTST
mgnify:FL=1